MKKKVLNWYESIRDNIFLFIGYVIVFSLLLSTGIIMAIRFPGLFKFAGLIMIVGSFYFLSYYPTFKSNSKL
jgi:hypothetical protein